MFERVRKYVQTLKTDNLTLAFEYSKEKKMSFTFKHLNLL